MMDTKALNHAYHRSRVDAHMSGSAALILLMLVFAFVGGDRFKPFQQGADMWSSTLLAWHAETNAWIPITSVLQSNPDAIATGQMITKEIYPRCYSVVVILGSLVAAFFVYGCAARQTRLMRSVYDADDKSRPYDRPWSEIRVTFWAMFAILLGVLFLFMM